MADLILILLGFVIGIITGYFIWKYNDDGNKHKSSDVGIGGSDNRNESTGREEQFK